MRAFLGLGSNQGDRLAHLQKGMILLTAEKGITILRVSSVYETEPVLQDGEQSSAAFYNAVIEIDFTGAIENLIPRLLEIEKICGRVRSKDTIDRTLDLDLILAGGTIIKTKETKIPHPLFRDRKFVLAPLCELAPETVDPVTKKRAAELLEFCPDEHGIRFCPEHKGWWKCS